MVYKIKYSYKTCILIYINLSSNEKPNWLIIQYKMEYPKV